MFNGHLQMNIPNPISPNFTPFSIFPISVNQITVHLAAQDKNSRSFSSLFLLYSTVDE